MKFPNRSIARSKDMACIKFHSDFFSKGHNPRKGDNSDEKKKTKTRVSYLSMRNPGMNFQNPSMHGS